MTPQSYLKDKVLYILSMVIFPMFCMYHLLHQTSFSPDDVDITELASGKLVEKGLANHHAKAYEFSHFVADAKPTTLLTHGNEVSILWHERFGHLNFEYLQQLQKNSMVEVLPVIKSTTGICKGCVVEAP